MSAASDVTCPKCSHKFALTETMSKSIRAELEGEFAKKRVALEERLAEQTAAASGELDSMREKLEADYQSKLKAEAKKAAAQAAASQAVELGDLREQVEAQAEKIRAANAKELELRKAQREVEESRANLELELTRKLDEEREKIRAEASSQAVEDIKLQKATWSTQREGMERLIEDLKKKVEQGSTQTQGEALELEVEATLREAFPHDTIEPVAKGVKGSDVLQRIQTRTGQHVGTIAWELKRTKNWTDSWIPKLKDDMRAAKAEVAVIVTQALPEGVKHIGQVEGVWVVDHQSFIGIALALRSSIIEVAQAKQALVGKKEKLDYLYDYLSGSEFRGRIEAITEAFVTMREDLESERRAFEKVWAKREKALTRALNNTAGVYGDLQGLIGVSLQEIPQLSLEVK